MEILLLPFMVYPCLLSFSAHASLFGTNVKTFLYAYCSAKPGSVAIAPLSWTLRLKVMKGVAKGLVYLHECSPKKYVHGDLKPSNIILEDKMEPKISDFGLGRLANIAGNSPTFQRDFAAFTSTALFGSCYQAPETMKAGKPSQKWDVYSYGMILLEMMTGKTPLVQVGNAEMDLVQWMQLCVEEKKPVCDVLDPNLAQDDDKEEEMMAVLKIAIACTKSSPERRPSMRHVLDALERLPAPSAV